MCGSLMDMQPNPPPAANRVARLTSPLALSVLLALAVLGLYWLATGFKFSHYDDPTYYAENSHVQAGLGRDGLLWAFCTGTASNWHPLTWLSLMLDADLGNGPKDGWTPHFTNILLHALDTVLLFWVLLRAALAIDPNDKDAHFDLANILDDEGQTEESIREYRAAMRADPAYYPAAYNLALVLERLGRRDEAIAAFKDVLQI